MTREALMRYPAQDCRETRREAAKRRALTRRVEALRKHADEFGHGKEAQAAGPRVETVRATARGVALSHALFRAADYGQLCQLLGLSPSRPDRNVEGKRRKGPR